MKKQFTKIKIAAENLRSSKTDHKDSELEFIEKQVEKYRDTIERILRKLPAINGSGVSPTAEEQDKRLKKNTHYKIGQALDESSRDLPRDMPLQRVLENCGELEKSIAECIVENELETETKVIRRLRYILDKEIQEISALKRNVSRTLQEYTSLKRSYEAAIRLEEPDLKIKQIKCQQEECEVKLEKERDTWAAQMFELIAKEDEIVSCIRDYVLNQRNYHERALQRVNSSLASMHDTIQSTEKSRFGTSLRDHLKSSDREISYIIELCVCCLVEHGLCEEGLLRVGCASTKMKRMKHALEAKYVKTPLPSDYQDPHVISSILKSYLRELPEPMLTYTLYKDFVRVIERQSETERKAEIKAILSRLPAENYANLRYLTRFLWLVTQHVEQNKMSSQNLAIVMAPNMLWPRVDKSNAADYLGQVNSSSAANIIVELLISQWDYFFEGANVDFFVTLQPHKLFAENKSIKSNSSNEHLDKHDGEVLESPRYGTIRRQKANAPSPPVVKGNDTLKTNGETQQQRIHVKELFPQPQQQQQQQNVEKPEKPPFPKLIPLQQPTTAATTTTTTVLPTTMQPLTPAKPVPLTRTQFFGLDNLPSPVADRKSCDSINSLHFKPDLPQKPKIPKRPMVLGLSGSGGQKSDEELTTPTPTPTPTQQQQTVITDNDSSHNNSNNIVRTTTEKFIDKLRQENNCDNGERGTVVTTNNANKENNHNQMQLLDGTEQNSNNTMSTSTSTTGTGTVTMTTTSVQNLSNNLNNITQQQQTQPQQQKQQMATQVTPTTPISPNMFQTPKRPTVPAPPPPIVVKKQAD